MFKNVEAEIDTNQRSVDYRPQRLARLALARELAKGALARPVKGSLRYRLVLGAGLVISSTFGAYYPSVVLGHSTKDAAPITRSKRTSEMGSGRVITIEGGNLNPVRDAKVSWIPEEQLPGSTTQPVEIIVNPASNLNEADMESTVSYLKKIHRRLDPAVPVGLPRSWSFGLIGLSGLGAAALAATRKDSTIK